MQLFDQLHPDWQVALGSHRSFIESVEQKLDSNTVAPVLHNIFRTLTKPISATKVVIFGQDPYPTKGHANGLAFSVAKGVTPLPPSLRNIFQELSNDLGTNIRENGDLSDWFEQGVMLLNRILTTETGTSMAHKNLGWEQITNTVAAELGKRKVVGIFWGNSAGELKKFFSSELIIQSVHPSPLSAYKGFFGSKPFSRCNTILKECGSKPIKWD